jgi:DNA-binding MurR/RpiR family transcriptional regulator
MILKYAKTTQTIHPPDDDFLARLARAQPRLSPKMAQLATFLGEQYLRAAFMSTRELAAAAGVSLATVVRFPTLLGYRNFEELRASIQDRVNFDLTGVDRLRSLPTTDRSAAGLLRRIIEADVEALRTVLRTFSEPQFERFLGTILRAERVTILGFRYVRPLTSYFAYSLSKIKSGVTGISYADSSLYDRIRLMDEDDALIAIAFARYPRDLVDLVRYAHGLGTGIHILAITDSPLSPLLPLAEATLFAKAAVLDFVGSLAAPAALINCIVSALGVRLGQQALRRLEALEDAARVANIYVTAGGHPAPTRNSFLASPRNPSPRPLPSRRRLQRP